MSDAEATSPEARGRDGRLSDEAGGAKQDPAREPAGEASPPHGEGAPLGSPEATGAVQVTAGQGRGRYLAHVRFGALATTGTATATTSDFDRNDPVILRTNRGTELAIAVTSPEPVEGDVDETVGHVLRRATGKDLAEQGRIEDEIEPEESRFCKKKIAERGLRMRLSSVEHIFGGERIIFYFTAERRVDFRALVRDLAWHFHARIELRQIGARDEARLLADFEHCGQPLCCKVFLRHLEPVTMRMAKLQRTTLDPQKISGRCGRLMCCLRFEDEVYRELRKGLPRKGTRVHVDQKPGEVVSTDILTQRATVRLEDGDTIRVPVTDLRPRADTQKAETEGEPKGSEAPSAPSTRAAVSTHTERDGGRRRRSQKSGRPGARQQKPRRSAQPQRDGSGTGPAGGAGDAAQATGGGQPRRDGRRRSKGRGRRQRPGPPEGSESGSPVEPGRGGPSGAP